MPPPPILAMLQFLQYGVTSRGSQVRSLYGRFLIKRHAIAFKPTNPSSLCLDTRLTPRLPDIFAEWAAHATGDLLRVLTYSVPPGSPGMTILAAYTYLKCCLCEQVRSFSHAIFHSCTNKRLIPNSSLSIDQPFEAIARSAYKRQRWSPAVFSIDDGSIIRMQLLFNAACRGCVRHTTTIEMNKLVARLVCKFCPNKPMAWRTAVRLDPPHRVRLTDGLNLKLYHCLTSHRGEEDDKVTWTSILPKNVPKDQTDDWALSDQLYDAERSWACAHCNPYDGMLYDVPTQTKDNVIKHARSHTATPVLGRDFYRVVDAKPFLVLPASW
ncbi:hypothetical protein DXG03_008084 [Asterophora parasitica]|uniref:Uncharacterized protein n=1 Tax=Asterophora parasitica TaxID=117018 RepID=A0A9P7KAH1_9AGAR|nr:hypothetical protein DXG03_008084 [Asterophora parasitica]